MTGPRDDDATLDDVIQPIETAPADHREHGKAPARPNDDELAHRAQHEANEVHDPS